MEPYFVWKGINSRVMGIWVLSQPPITRPPRRYQQVTIPGRPGALTLLEGDDVYDPYIRECRIMPKPGANLPAILAWLTGSGSVVFSEQPTRAQHASIFDEVAMQREFADQRSATLRFLCDPFKYDPFDEQLHTMTVADGTYTLPGRGDVKAYPMIVLTATGAATVTVNGTPLSVEDLSGQTAFIDCSARTTYRKVTEDDVTTNVPVVTHGDYPVLKPHGDNVITWDEAVSALVIHPEWRWF